MRFDRSRRAFLEQGSTLAVLSTGTGAPRGRRRPSRPKRRTAACAARKRGIKSFKGIPYAASTAGKNRFMPPMKPAAWTGVRDALDYGARAPQQQPRPRGEADEQGATAGQRESEDCLLLNVWTPGLADGGKRPVIMWCHGGGFNTGSGAAPVNDGTNLG